MNAETIIGAVCVSIVAVIMFAIGGYQFLKKDEPVGFYNMTNPPRKEEISDVMQWNKKHGMIWLVYGLCIELGFWLGYLVPVTFLQVVFVVGGGLLPMPFMVVAHHKLEKEYKQN